MKLPALRTGTLLIPLLVLIAALAPRAAEAQIPGRPRGPSINPGTLADFAKAWLDIGEIEAERASRVRAATDSSEIARIRAEADSAVEHALAEQRLTRDDYDAIGEILSEDAEVRQEFEMILARVRREREAGAN
ncbi:MAG TPA: DUF4168 domain-containing protein [Longimicrobiales bacterium]|nr:DUF4168 domain-containing protein [Longimicrobiales bacterium]